MKKIIVIGDIILDEYIIGTVNRISPEAPVPILNKDKVCYKLGGAANVALNLRGLKTEVRLYGRIGVDIYSQIILQLLFKNCINNTLLYLDSKIPTIVKTRFLANNHYLLRVDIEDITPFKYLAKIKRKLKKDIQKADGIIVSDYNKGFVTEEIARYCGDLAKKYNKPIVVDTHKSNIKCFSGYTAITPNKLELENIISNKIKNKTDWIKYSKQVLIKYNLQSIILTLSENGIYYTTSSTSKHFPTKVKNIADVTGAGDTVLAVYTWAIVNGYNEIKAIELSNLAASIVIQKPGTEPIFFKELFK